ncbi:MAG: hypothetical protein NZM09_09620 [Ignavibacterium sp.]|nr:hypothetical protein [Ignavibacterium sp.]MDW8375935.1 hypothetical protein [Ignavibacteriales bacterium]
MNNQDELVAKFKLDLFEGHPIINHNQDVILIDTGAPSSIHDSGTINFCSKDYKCLTNFLGIEISKISSLLGKEITALLGVDILSQYKVIFDYRNNSVEFLNKKSEFDGTEIEISTFMGIPIIPLSIENKNLRFFLDTGAKLSYVSKSLTSNLNSIGIFEDFYPLFGKFQTEVFNIPTYFEGEELNVNYGNLPPFLESTLLLSNAIGIIGFDFFNNFKIELDLMNKRIKYKRY